MFEEFADRVIYGNPLHDWIVAGTVALVVIVLTRLLKGLVIRALKQRVERRAAAAVSADAPAESRSEALEFVLGLSKRGSVTFYVMTGIFAGSHWLTLKPKVETRLEKLFGLALLLQLCLWLDLIVAHGVRRWLTRRSETGQMSATGGVIVLLARVALWSSAFLLALANVGVDVSALVTGLGIGGVAVALAVQSILGDLFASLSIAIDQPFEAGDMIQVDAMTGRVEKVGLKTTQVRSVSGEQLIFPNSNLLQSRIRNFRRMVERRVLSTISVVYRTPAETLAAMPGWLREAVEAESAAFATERAVPNPVQFGRAHLKMLNASSIDFELVYFLNTPDYDLHLDLQQRILLAIVRKLNAESVDFAFPSQSVYVESLPKAKT
jgi:small-conductance mechanosensitive channel